MCAFYLEKKVDDCAVLAVLTDCDLAIMALNHLKPITFDPRLSVGMYVFMLGFPADLVQG